MSELCHAIILQKFWEFQCLGPKFYTGLAVSVMRASGLIATPDSKVHGAIMGPIWDRQDPGNDH